MEITGIILYGGKKWLPKRGRKGKLRRRIRLMEHLKSLGLNNTLRVNKKGKPITIDCVIAGIYAWLYPGMNKKSPGNSKAKKKNCQIGKKMTRDEAFKMFERMFYDRLYDRITDEEIFAKEDRKKIVRNIIDYDLNCASGVAMMRVNSKVLNN